MKRKQYDAYGTASFEAGAAGAGAGAGRQYWSSGPSIDPEELFRKIFGEFSGSPFGDFQTVFDQPQEVGEVPLFRREMGKSDQRLFPVSVTECSGNLQQGNVSV